MKGSSEAHVDRARIELFVDGRSPKSRPARSQTMMRWAETKRNGDSVAGRHLGGDFKARSLAFEMHVMPFVRMAQTGDVGGSCFMLRSLPRAVDVG